ncbi:hypothetical protein C3L33_20060, partial [Rhododendron williamsianum]
TSRRRPVIRCSSLNGGEPESVDKEAESVQRLLEEKRLISFTYGDSFISLLKNGLSKFGAPSGMLELLSQWTGPREDYPKIPEAKGAIRAIRSEPFFIPLYELYLTYGGIFRLTFGPKSFLIVSDPSIAKHILRDNSKSYSKVKQASCHFFDISSFLFFSYSLMYFTTMNLLLFSNRPVQLLDLQGILAEILEFVMGKGLIPADGEIWRVRRRAIVPALHQKYVAAMISMFGQATDRLCQKLDEADSNGEDVEMESLFSRLTLDIIGKAVFNYDFDSLTNDTGIVEAVYTVLREAEDRSVQPIPFWEIPIWKDISPKQKKVKASLKLINEILDNLIAICKRMVEEEELQFHEDYINEQDPSILHFLLASGDDVSSKQLRDDLMTMLIAGHETSAAVLTWTFFLLSKEPSVMSKLQNEVDSVLGDRFPTIEDMKKLKYTTRVINESLRLYPQPPVLIRRSLADDMLGKYPIRRLRTFVFQAKGLVTLMLQLMQLGSIPSISFPLPSDYASRLSPRGEDIFISVWNLHRCPKHWEDADKFNPERWPLDGPNPNETNQNFSYLPFGGGPRKCVGDMFASFENIVAVAMLVRRFNFEVALGAPCVEMTTGATIHTTEGLNMRVTRRIKPPIMPELELPVLNGNTGGLSEVEPELAQREEIAVPL